MNYPNVKTLLGSRNVTEERAAEMLFPASEAIAISGVSRDSLATWHKRHQLPKFDFPEAPPGHGNTRLYSLPQVVVLAVAQFLMKRGLAVDDAMAIASFEPAIGGFVPEPNDSPAAVAVKSLLHRAERRISREVFGLVAELLFLADERRQILEHRSKVNPSWFAVYREKSAAGEFTNRYICDLLDFQSGLFSCRAGGLAVFLVVDADMISTFLCDRITHSKGFQASKALLDIASEKVKQLIDEIRVQMMPANAKKRPPAPSPRRARKPTKT